MRLKHIQGSEAFIAENDFVVHEPEKMAGKWKDYFGNEKPLYIEIGTGKGQFVNQHALRNKNNNYLGIERYDSVLMKAVKKAQELQTEDKNLGFISFDAKDITEVFAKGEVKVIYLNFSDPWPKKRHAKRRLTSPVFLEKYKQILSEDGHIEFKTDNVDLFDYSLESFKENGFELSEVTRDLHNSEYSEGNIMTEYEEKFSGEGKPIMRLSAKVIR